MNGTIVNAKVYDRRWLILIVIALSLITIILSESMVNIALPTIQTEFSAAMSELQWTANAYMLTFAGFMLLMGMLGDRLGRKTLILLGTFIFGGANLLAMFVENITALIVLRLVMGVGAAMILPATLALITDIFPEEERGKAIGLWAGINSIGIALGPIIGGALVKHYAWNSIFFVNIPVAGLALLIGFILLPNTKDSNPRPADILGTILATLSVGALIFGLNQGGSWGWGDARVLTALIGAGIGLLFFILWEKKTPNPMLDLSFFRKPRFGVGVTAVSIMSLALVGIIFILSIFMQFVKSFDSLQTGIRLLPLAGGIFIGAGTSDKIVKKIGTSRVMLIGFIGNAVVAFLIAFCTADTAYWLLGFGYFGIGFFLGYIAAPATDAIMGSVPEGKTGIGSAMNSVCRIIAGAVGVALLGSILSSVYSAAFSDPPPVVAALPSEAASAAKESVGAAMMLAGQIGGETGAAIADFAKTSFMKGWRVLAFISCGLSLAGGIITAGFMPNRKEAVEPAV